MSDFLASNWMQLRGKSKEWWGRLTADDLMRINGKRDNLVAALQKRYGYARERAQAEIHRKLDEYEKSHTDPIQHLGRFEPNPARKSEDLPDRVKVAG